MSPVFDTCNIICFSVRQLSSSWKNLASAMPVLGPTVKHSLKAVVIHNIILVLVSIRVVVKNKCFVSHCYSIMLFCSFSPESACWKAQGRFHNTIYEFGIPAIQSACVCACVRACMHAGACVITQMHEDSCIDIVHYGKHTNVLLSTQKYARFLVSTLLRLIILVIWVVTLCGRVLKALLRTLTSVNSATQWNIPGDSTWNKKIYSKYTNGKTCAANIFLKMPLY